MGYDIQKEILKAKRLMGVVSEISNPYIDLSAWKNMMFQSELYGLNRKECCKIAAELLEDFGLYERKDTLVKYFSKGMKQRLSICLALLSKPEVLFLDEPTSGLDIESSIIIRKKLKEINKNGTTIFLTTHNMEEANQLCERVAIINHGKIVAIDTPEKLKATIKELQTVQVSFDHPVKSELLANLKGVIKAEESGDKIKLHTSSPGEIICKIVDFARKEKLNIVTLNVLTPTLEEVFLKLTERGKKDVRTIQACLGNM